MKRVVVIPALSIAILVGWLLAVQPAPAEVTGALATLGAADLATPEQLSEQEIIRRKEQLLRGEKYLSDADAAMKARKYDEAITLYQQALGTLPRSVATAKEFSAAASGLVKANLAAAHAAQRAKNNADARRYADEALKLDPKNGDAKGIIAHAEKIQKKAPPQEKVAATKPPPPVDKTPDFRKEQQQVVQFMRDAHLAFQSNQLDLAADKLNQVMAIDRYNEEARQLLRQVNEQRFHTAGVDMERVRAQYAADTAEAWAPPIRGALIAPVEQQPTTQVVSKEKEEIERKLDTIIIPQIEFKEAAIPDVVDFLSKASRELDKATSGGNGVNIVLGGGLSGGSGGGAAAAAAPEAPAPAPGAAMPGVPGAPAAPAAPGAPGAAGGAAPAIPGIPGAPGVPGAEAAPAATPAASGTPAITLNLHNVPLRDALRYVTDIAGLKFKVESRAVVIVPASWEPAGNMVSRNYKIQAGVFATILTGGGAAGGGAAGGPAPAGGAPAPPGAAAAGPGATTGGVSSEEVKKFFTDAGVKFPANASITYQDRINTLFVKNTPEELDVFEQVLASLNIVPTQVTIEAKFVEIKQTDLRELGFDWILGDLRFGSFGNVNNRLNLEGGGNSQFQGFPGRSNAGGNNPVFPGDTTGGSTDRVQGNRFAGDTGTLPGNALDALLSGSSGGSRSVPDQVVALSGLLTDPQFQVVLRALSQRQNVDLLTAPKVTTLSGQQAKIEVIREFIYPTEFEPPRVAAASGGTGGGSISVPVVSPPTPGGFQTRNLGVTLNVTPQVGPDGYTINLTLIPEVSDFDGFIDYGSRNNLGDAGNSGQIGLAFPFPQPIFSSRRVTTSVILWDGQTVVLGGLIREDAVKIKDKIPFLGDIPLLGKLFRSEIENNVKRNLLIFVTAKLINPAGEPIHKTAATASGTAPPPPQAGGPVNR